ncbi:UNVERIFIED_CONTAM: hypothetical protein GTU68_025747, partial [Idotea baltica]|nr:hypothetical protein [Idotea baltica]
MELLEKYLDFIVFGALLSMSFVMLACVVERYIFLSSISLAEYNTENEITLATTKRLAYISSVASNAPYVGLLG